MFYFLKHKPYQALCIVQKVLVVECFAFAVSWCESDIDWQSCWWAVISLSSVTFIITGSLIILCMYLTLKSSTAGTRFTETNDRREIAHIFKLSFFPPGPQRLPPLIFSHITLCFFPPPHFDAPPLRLCHFSFCPFSIFFLVPTMQYYFFHFLTLSLSSSSSRFVSVGRLFH